MDSQKIISGSYCEVSPEPVRGLARWRTKIAAAFGRGPDSRWGSQLMRIASDTILVCDESLEICHHNKAFLKAIGHTQGSFKGKNLINFFPSEDREDLIAAFARLRRGHAAGMRLTADFLTTKGPRQFDARVVRNRTFDGSFFYYLVVREITEKHGAVTQTGDSEADPLFGNSPVAVWRTDEKLQVLQAYGRLWSDLGVTKEFLVGANLGQNEEQILPRFLLDIDYCDTLAGMTLGTEVVWDGEPFSVTVEPLLDSGGRMAGTIGIMRRAKKLSRNVRLEISESPGLSVESRPRLKTRKVLLEPVAVGFSNGGEVSNLHRRSSAPYRGLESTRNEEEAVDLDSVALSN